MQYLARMKIVGQGTIPYEKGALQASAVGHPPYSRRLDTIPFGPFSAALERSGPFHSVGLNGCQGQEFSEFPKPPSSGHAVPSKIELRDQLDETLIAGCGCRVGWRHGDVSGGIHQGGRVEIGHV